MIEKCVERADQSIIDDFKTIIFEGESSQIMKILLRSQYSFFIVGKIYSRLIIEGDRERLLRMLQDNLIHAGDKLIKSKCVALINKGYQLGESNSKKLDLTPGGVGQSPDHSKKGDDKKSSDSGSNGSSDEKAQQIIDFVAEQKRKSDLMFEEITDGGVEEEKESQPRQAVSTGEQEFSPKYAFRDPQDQQTPYVEGGEEEENSSSLQKQQISKINQGAEV